MDELFSKDSGEGISSWIDRKYLSVLESAKFRPSMQEKKHKSNNIVVVVERFNSIC